MSTALRVAAALAGLAVAGLVSAGCSSGGHTPTGGTAGGATASGVAAALPWRACPRLAKHVQCASLRVPLDYRHPGGRKITLALSRIPATAPASKRQGVLLVNPGGPGGSGLKLAAFVAQGLTPAVASQYDIIGFDTRGTGHSVPALHCDPSFFSGVRPDYIPATKAAERALVSRARGYAADCEKKYGWLLPYMTTPDFARDLNSIRIALGQPKISYFAYSYGTYIGQVYATMFPGHVRRMVLDSTVDPAGVWFADNLSQDYAFQGRMEAFFSWAAGFSSTYRLGTTPAAVSRSWHQARARLLADPASGASGPLVGPDEFDDTFLAGGYNDQYWPALATALSIYLHQHATGPLIRLYRQAGRQNENEFAVYNAVQCSDASWPRDWATWDHDARKIFATAPFEAWDNTWFNAACAFWPVKGPARPVKINGAGLPGILMLQGTRDAATPYQGALVARRRLPTARMVVVTGGGNHGQALAVPPNSCVDGYVSRYLATGSLPGPVPGQRAALVSATCPAGPPPAP
jgi:pimeloyl-ACP methyl ester carboxylesterase